MPRRMSNSHRATPHELALWTKRIERQRDTWLTRGEYAAEIGVDESTWARWEHYLDGRSQRRCEVVR
jgi:hypothetical protein